MVDRIRFAVWLDRMGRVASLISSMELQSVSHTSLMIKLFSRFSVEKLS